MWLIVAPLMVLGAPPLPAQAGETTEVSQGNRSSELETLGVVIEPPPDAPAGFPRALSEPGPYIEHTVVPNEKLEHIAARYGVSKLHLKTVNAKVLKTGYRAGRVLRVRARRTPPPKRKVTTTVREGEDWTALRKRLGVTFQDLKAWNWKNRRLRVGSEIVAWVDPDTRTSLTPEIPLARPKITVRGGAHSRGRPDRGRLLQGVRLPDSYLYTLKAPRTSWGSNYAVEAVLEAIVALRSKHGFRGPLIVGSMSRPKGGKFAPHKSHQSGRDLDIFLPLLPQIPLSWNPDPAMIDWAATWALVRSFEATGRVEMIFIDTRVQRHLHAAAVAAGATEAELDRLIGWPRWPAHQKKALVQHSPGHNRHMHVRIRCGPQELECYSRWGDPEYRAIEARKRAEEAAGKR